MERLADLAVSLGANLQPGQVLRSAAETGHLESVRAMAEAGCRRARRSQTSTASTRTCSARLEPGPAGALGHVPA